MTKTVNAIYENGVFEPIKKIKLPEHEQFRLTVSSLGKKTRAVKKTASTQKRVLNKIIGIESSGSSGGSVHHDKYPSAVLKTVSSA